MSVVPHDCNDDVVNKEAERQHSTEGAEVSLDGELVHPGVDVHPPAPPLHCHKHRQVQD